MARNTILLSTLSVMTSFMPLTSPNPLLEQVETIFRPNPPVTTDIYEDMDFYHRLSSQDYSAEYAVYIQPVKYCDQTGQTASSKGSFIQKSNLLDNPSTQPCNPIPKGALA